MLAWGVAQLWDSHSHLEMWLVVQWTAGLAGLPPATVGQYWLFVDFSHTP
jgi:hypothetical protein